MPREPSYRDESDVKKQVKNLLDRYEWFWWMPPSNAFGKSGISDFNALHSGVFIAIETKFGKNTPTTMQRGFLHSIQAESGFGFIVNETRIGALETWLAAFACATAATSRGEQPTPEDGAAMLNALIELTKEL